MVQLVGAALYWRLRSTVRVQKVVTNMIWEWRKHMIICTVAHSIAFPVSFALPQNNSNTTMLPSYDYPRLDGTQQWCVKNSERYNTRYRSSWSNGALHDGFCSLFTVLLTMHQQQANGYPTLELGPFSSVYVMMWYLFFFHNFWSQKNAWDMNFRKDCTIW